MQTNGNGADLGEDEAIAFEFHSGSPLGIDQGVVATVAFAPGRSRRFFSWPELTLGFAPLIVFPPVQELLIGSVETLEAVLQDLRIYRGEKGGLLLEKRQLPGLIAIADPSLFMLPSIFSFQDRPIVEVATNLQMLLQKSHLVRCWVEAVLEAEVDHIS